MDLDLCLAELLLDRVHLRLQSRELVLGRKFGDILCDRGEAFLNDVRQCVRSFARV